MDSKVYAFYRTAHSVVVEPGLRFSLREWPMHVARIFANGADVWQLHLDNPEDFDNIKKRFFTKEYWDNRTWVEEYNHITK